jgi:hypothetical protein
VKKVDLDFSQLQGEAPEAHVPTIIAESAVIVATTPGISRAKPLAFVRAVRSLMKTSSLHRWTVVLGILGFLGGCGGGP